jgi:SAM-dependent methyltransferase
VTDHYADGTYLWWHLSETSPELRDAVADRWLPSAGRALDVGCGLGTEAAHLHRLGWHAVGVDLSRVAVREAARHHPGAHFLQANLLHLPFPPATFDAAVDRGCFHYVDPESRSGYSAELRRVLRPGGKLLLRASLRAAGVRNDIDEQVIRTSFQNWTIDDMTRTKIPSDTRMLEVLLVRLGRPE